MSGFLPFKRSHAGKIIPSYYVLNETNVGRARDRQIIRSSYITKSWNIRLVQMCALVTIPLSILWRLNYQISCHRIPSSCIQVPILQIRL